MLIEIQSSLSDLQIRLLLAVLKAVVVGEEEAAAGGSQRSRASWGDRDAVGAQVHLPGPGCF